MDTLAVVLIALVAALALDATQLYGLLGTVILAGMWVSFRLTGGWPVWLRIGVVGLALFFPVVGWAVALIVRRRRMRRQTDAEAQLSSWPSRTS
jgi:hypothetical protein